MMMEALSGNDNDKTWFRETIRDHIGQSIFYITLKLLCGNWQKQQHRSLILVHYKTVITQSA